MSRSEVTRIVCQRPDSKADSSGTSPTPLAGDLERGRKLPSPAARAIAELAVAHKGGIAMRLHNRMVKPGFWTDPELVLWPRDKRMFYLGLVQLADDSGCLEESAVACKLHLYPLDTDITVEQIQTWIDELAEAGKVIRYIAGAKRCLWLKNFLKHQEIKNPGRASVATPPWVVFTPFPSNPRCGRYTVSEERLTHVLQSLTRKSDVAYTSDHEPEPEPEPEHEPERAALTTSAPQPLEPSPPNPFPVEETLALFRTNGRGFANAAQEQAYRDLFAKYGHDVYWRALAWGAKKRLGLGNIASMATAAEKIALELRRRPAVTIESTADKDTDQVAIEPSLDAIEAEIDEFLDSFGGESCPDSKSS